MAVFSIINTTSTTSVTVSPKEVVYSQRFRPYEPPIASGKPAPRRAIYGNVGASFDCTEWQDETHANGLFTTLSSWKNDVVSVSEKLFTTAPSYVTQAFPFVITDVSKERRGAGLYNVKFSGLLPIVNLSQPWVYGPAPVGGLAGGYANVYIDEFDNPYWADSNYTIQRGISDYSVATGGPVTILAGTAKRKTATGYSGQFRYTTGAYQVGRYLIKEIGMPANADIRASVRIADNMNFSFLLRHQDTSNYYRIQVIANPGNTNQHNLSGFYHVRNGTSSTLYGLIANANSSNMSDYRLLVDGTTVKVYTSTDGKYNYDTSKTWAAQQTLSGISTSSLGVSPTNGYFGFMIDGQPQAGYPTQSVYVDDLVVYY